MNHTAKISMYTNSRWYKHAKHKTLLKALMHRLEELHWDEKTEWDDKTLSKICDQIEVEVEKI